jgi:hypothetical protein
MRQVDRLIAALDPETILNPRRLWLYLHVSVWRVPEALAGYLMTNVTRLPRIRYRPPYAGCSFVSQSPRLIVMIHGCGKLGSISPPYRVKSAAASGVVYRPWGNR